MFVCAASAAGDHRFPLEFKTLAGNLMHLGAITVVRWSKKKKKKKKMKPSKTAPIGFLKGRGDFCGVVWWRWSVGASFKMSPLGIPPPPPLKCWEVNRCWSPVPMGR